MCFSSAVPILAVKCVAPVRGVKNCKIAQRLIATPAFLPVMINASNFQRCSQGIFARPRPRQWRQNRDRDPETETRQKNFFYKHTADLLFILYCNYGDQCIIVCSAVSQMSGHIHHFGCSCNVACPRESIDNKQCETETSRQRQTETVT